MLSLPWNHPCFKFSAFTVLYFIFTVLITFFFFLLLFMGCMGFKDHDFFGKASSHLRNICKGFLSFELLIFSISRVITYLSMRLHNIKFSCCFTVVTKWDRIYFVLCAWTESILPCSFGFQNWTPYWIHLQPKSKILYIWKLFSDQWLCSKCSDHRTSLLVKLFHFSEDTNP